MKDTSWIRTYTGTKFYPLNPSADDLAINDIAHALSNICRFTGHVRFFYSVAQHSVLVSRYLDSLGHEAAMTGLLHDGSEAYLCDIAKPIKTAPAMALYREADEFLQMLIYETFGVPPIPGDWLHEADHAIFEVEWRDLMPRDPGYTLPIHSHHVIEPWSPEYAKAEFLKRFDALEGHLMLASLNKEMGL